MLFTVFFGVRAHGLKNIPKRGGAILASNHQSFLDPVLIALPLERQIHFMARESLFRYRGFRWLIKALNAFPVRRGGAGPTDIERAVLRLREGKLVLVFPEGTRTRDGSVGKFSKGVARLARMGGACVVPVGINGAFQSWPRTRKIFRFRRLAVAYGKPLIPPQDKRYSEEFARKLKEETIKLVESLRRNYGRKNRQEKT